MTLERPSSCPAHDGYLPLKREDSSVSNLVVVAAECTTVSMAPEVGGGIFLLQEQFLVRFRK